MPRVKSTQPVPLILTLVILLGGALALWPHGSPGAAEPDETAAARLLRFPTLSKDAIAFVYAGDVWSVPRAGGLARQITSDPGIELLPHFSPDGKWIAFTGQYDGNRDVYVVSADGGVP